MEVEGEIDEGTQDGVGKEWRVKGCKGRRGKGRVGGRAEAMSTREGRGGEGR